MTDRDLVDRLRTGDHTAERDFYDRHVDRVYRLILRMSGRPELAQEWTQDTFIRAFSRVAQFRGDKALRRMAVQARIAGKVAIGRR